ncbi:hypothetical protein V6N13_076188 [Hibiscus sabdariffa]
MVELPVVVEELSPRPSKELNLAAFPPITQDDSTCSDFNCSAWLPLGNRCILIVQLLGSNNLSLPRFIDVGVDLAWSPPRCCSCAIFGHSEEKCLKKVSILTGMESIPVVEVVTTDHVLASDSIVDSKVVLASGAIDTIDVVDTGFNAIVVTAKVTGDVACLDKGNDKHFTVDDSTVVTGVGISYPNNVEGQELSPRKCRIAAGGVADLLNQLKPKAKGKHKKKGGKADGPSNSNMDFGSGWLEVGGVEEERVRLWRDLVNVKCVVGTCPCAIVGDFNVISRPQESSNFDGSQEISGAMQNFLNCQADLHVVDHHFSRALFTWCNRREEAPLSWKLDRVFINQEWFSAFLSATIEFLGPYCSDHSPNLLIPQVPLDSWDLPVASNPLHKLFANLKRLKAPPRQLNSEHFGVYQQECWKSRLRLRIFKS